MSLDVLLGLQWGDEGKGKIVDVLTPYYDTIARFQGGPNAGHTLEFNGIKQILHTIPSGIFHQQKSNIIGNGMVIDPVIFEKECLSINKNGGNVFNNLYISTKAHLILPSHRLLDAANEKAKGEQKIGSTLKGIGPAYADKISRIGLRIQNIFDNNFLYKYHFLKHTHLQQTEMLNTYPKDVLIDTIAFDEYEKKWLAAIEFIKKFNIIETDYYINEKIQNGQAVLAEGAQGSLLDIEFGSYPFVTSSNTTCAGAFSGLGVAPKHVGKVYGIFKAYCTRVGSGPFITEQDNQIGEKLRKEGNEYGSTTGRPRRCGWLDLPALKYAIMINGVTDLIMTKADVLCAFDEILVCTEYLNNENKAQQFNSDLNLEQIKPKYLSFHSWKGLSNVHTFEEMPENLKRYITFIEKHTGVKISIASIGPDRSQTIVLNR